MLFSVNNVYVYQILLIYDSRIELRVRNTRAIYIIFIINTINKF